MATKKPPKRIYIAFYTPVAWHAAEFRYKLRGSSEIHEYVLVEKMPKPRARKR